MYYGSIEIVEEIVRISAKRGEREGEEDVCIIGAPRSLKKS